MFLYWPLLFCAIPNTVTRGEETFNDHEQGSHIRNSALETIPIDDLSPITLAVMVRNCIKMLPTLSHGFNVKLFFIRYCVIPIFFYIKLVLYFIIKSNYPLNDASRKLLFQAAVDRPLVYVLFILPYLIIPGVLILSWRQEKGTSPSHITPQKEIIQQIKDVPRIIPQKLLHLLKAFLSICLKGRLHDTHVHSQHSLCGHVICVLWTALSILFFAPVVALLALLVILFTSVICTIIYSPYFCLMKVTFRYIHKRPVYRGILFLNLVYSPLRAYILAVFSCQFVVRMFGFTIIIWGLALNAEVTIPYVTFLYVVWRNIHLCFTNLQNRYKQVKEMTSEQ